MKKGVAVAIVCVSILLLVSMPIVSANWFDDLLNNIADFFGGDAGITGEAVGVCTDSDGGVDKFNKGNCIPAGSGGGWDSCVNPTTVKEYSCSEFGTCPSSNIACGEDYHCTDGECVVDTYVCGNGVIESIEQCDDDNEINGDGCSEYCQLEEANCFGIPTVDCGDYAYQDLGCALEPPVCGDVATGGSNCGPGGDDSCYDCVLGGNCGNLNEVQCGEMDGLGCTWSLGDASYCGDGTRDITFGEECDDGNQANNDGCTSGCKTEVCGDGLVQSGLGETCDFGVDNGVAFGCDDVTCLVNNDGVCGGSITAPAPTCGSYNTLFSCTEGDPLCEWDGSTCRNKSCSTWDGDAYLCYSVGCTWGASGGESPETCGNEILDDGEECDGALLDSQTCSNQPGYVSGTLECDNDCIGFNMTNCILDENEVLGCTDIGAANYDSEATIGDGSCEYSEDCSDAIDNDGVGGINNGCDYYNISELIFPSGERWEDAETIVSCKFDVTDYAGDIVDANVSDSCMLASVFDSVDAVTGSACSIVRDGDSNGVNYRTFECDVGSVGNDKMIKCFVDPDGPPSCSLGLNPTSEPAIINVTTPLVCPPSLNDGTINVGPSITLEDKDLDAGDNLIFDWELENLVSSNDVEIEVKAGLYELNWKEILDTDTETIVLDSNSDEVGMLLKVPSTISEGNHRVYIKTIDVDETEFCILSKYDVNVEASSSGSSSVDLDFRTAGSSSIEISVGGVMTFTLNGVTEHSIELESISGAIANLIIRSNPIDLALAENDEEEVDLEGDGIFDISIRLTQITGNSVVIILDALESFETCFNGQIQSCGYGGEGTQFCLNNVWGSCEDNSVGGSDTGSDNSGDAESGFPWVVVIVIAIIIAIFFILIVISKRKFDKKTLNKGSNFSQGNSGPGPRSSPPGQLMMRRPVVSRPPVRRP